MNYVDPSGHSITAIVLMISLGTLVGAAFGFALEIGTQLKENGEITSIGTALNKTIVGGALGFSSSMGVAFLGPLLAGSATASAGGALAAFITSVGLSAASGAGGYVVQEKMDGRGDLLNTANIVGHAGIVGIQGVSNFAVGGMVGSIGNIGQKGKFITKEFMIKWVLTQEFSFPFKYATNKFRHGLWG